MAVINNKLILASLDEYVTGHLEAKKTLINMLSRSRMRHYQKYMRGMDEEFLISPSKVLLIGQSGTGKTHLVESLQKVVHFPLVRVDATQMNPAGATGGTKPQKLRDLIYTAASEAKAKLPNQYFSIDGAVDRTVVFIDEIDKLGVSWESSGNWNRHVQSNFLTMFDNKEEFSGVSYIFAGAFAGLTGNPKNNLGFTASGEDKNTSPSVDSKILSAGLIPELVGRINAICELDVFTESDLYNILVNRILPKKQMDLAAYNIMDTFVEKPELERIAREAKKSEQGIRHMQREVDKIFMELEFDADVDFVY